MVNVGESFWRILCALVATLLLSACSQQLAKPRAAVTLKPLNVRHHHGRHAAGRPTALLRLLQHRDAYDGCLGATGRSVRERICAGATNSAAHSDDVDQSIRCDADQIGAKRRKALSV